ncbi:MAG: MFS transporter [Propionibacteriaceae bacterium]|jgi:OFA family oxalate/formate antiporter-like MFS transporter|nr:MFS transporter [Propionibacteriaceae bacterium]
MRNNKWSMLTVGTVLMLIMGLIYAWSIFRAPLSEAFPAWSATDLSLTFTLSMVFFCIGGFVGGRLVPHIKHRGVLLLAGILLAIGFLGLSFYRPDNGPASLIMLYVFYGVIGGFAIGLGYNCVMSAVTRAFPGRVGFASGVLLMGFGLGGMILGSVVNLLTGVWDLPAVFRFLGVLMFVVLVAGAFLMGTPTPVATGATPSAGSVEDKTTTQMLKTSAFWFFALWMIVISSAGLLIINSAATISLAFGGAAVLGLIVSVFNGLGRVIFGALFDKVGRVVSMTISTGVMLLAGVVLIVGALTGSLVLILVGLPLVGIAYGSAPTITSATVTQFYGPTHYGSNFATINFAIIPAAILGPLLASRLQESSSGDYTTTFVMVAVLAVVAYGFFWAVTTAGKRLHPKAD